ncbi:MAG: low molecular weight protein-tyrosine-phosphatase [Eubacteriales bacterium]|nr:low molecular weight protein-tyrosine-phosphatase [Eubacteriales bacterium]
MIKVLFVCLGNICRSPMAEFIFRDMVQKRGLAGQFRIASAATSREEIGNPVYPPAQRKLREHGIDPSGKRARQMTGRDYEEYDYLLAAERRNITNMLRITGGDPQHKIRRLLDYSDRPRDIDDPWYSGDFETAYRDITEGCAAFLDYLQREGLTGNGKEKEK